MIKHYKYTKELLEPVVKESYSIAQVLTKLGLVQAGGTHYHISRTIKDLNISTTHFTGRAHNKGKISPYKHTKKSLLKQVFKLNGNRTTGSKLRYWLVAFNFKKDVCELCGCEPTWRNKKLVLEVDHKNGNHFDNRIRNLRLLCPNCHSQLPTNGRKK